MSSRILDHSQSLKALLVTFATILFMAPGSLVAEAEHFLKDLAHQSPTSQNAGFEVFKVADSIKMTHFVVPSEWDPGAAPPVSPDGKQFLVVTERGLLESNLREFRLLIFKVEGATLPSELAVFRSSSNRDGITEPKWLNNNEISFLAENPGQAPQVYLANCRTHKLKKLTANSLGVRTYQISADGHTVLYAGTFIDSADKSREDHGFAIEDELLQNLASGAWKQHPSVPQLYLVNTVTGRERKVISDLYFSVLGEPPMWLSPDGKYAVVLRPAPWVPSAWGAYDDRFLQSNVKEQQGMAYRMRPHGVEQAMLLDIETATMAPLVDAPFATYGRSVTWMPNSRSVLLTGAFLPLNVTDPSEIARRKAFPALAEVKIPSRSYLRIADIPRDERWYLKEANQDSIALECWKTIEDGTEKELARRLVRQNDGWWTLLDREPSDSHATVVRITQALNQRPKLVRIDGATRESAVILDPNPQLARFQFGETKFIHWKGKRGEPLAGGLVYPTNYVHGSRVPLVIQTHGFSPDLFLVDGPFTTAFAAQELANRGIAVLQLDYSPLYHAAHSSPDFGPVQLSQLESAVDYLDSIGLIDRNKVALVGFSMTGFEVRYALMRSTYPFAAATSAEGNDWGYFSYVAFGNDPSWAAQSEAPYEGPPWSNLKPWLEGSISFNYDKIHTPLRLESDSNDSAEVLNEWESFFALKRLHRPVELIYVAHGAHPVVKPWDRMTSQQGNVDWLLFWLKGEEDPDPSKKEQYQRWHTLTKLQLEDSHRLKTQP